MIVVCTEDVNIRLQPSTQQKQQKLPQVQKQVVPQIFVQLQSNTTSQVLYQLSPGMSTKKNTHFQLFLYFPFIPQFTSKVDTLPHSLASRSMFNNRNANLWRFRLLLIPFTLVVGALFAASRSLETQERYYDPDRLDPRETASIAISFISFVTYVYAVWGAARVPAIVKSFLVFGLALACSIAA